MTIQLGQYGVLQKHYHSSFPSLTPSLPFPASSCSRPLPAVIRNPCAMEWVACQDQVCFCPFKGKKPRGTFPGREWEREERREGHLEVIESKRKGSFLAVFILLKLCSVLKTKARTKKIWHFCTTWSSLRSAAQQLFSCFFTFFKLQMLEIKETCWHATSGIVGDLYGESLSWR